MFLQQSNQIERERETFDRMKMNWTLTCRLSKFELARQPNKSVNNVWRISLNVRGVFEMIVFQTCNADWRTVSAISDRPMYNPTNSECVRSACHSKSSIVPTR